MKHVKLSLIRRLKTFSQKENGQLLPVNFKRNIVCERYFKCAKPANDSSATLKFKKAGNGWSEEDFGLNGISLKKEKHQKGWWNGVAAGENRKLILDIQIPVGIN